jgi:DNA polymerase
MAIKAVLDPGTWYTYRWLSYGVFNDVLYCLLPSGRCISYHQPRLTTVNSRMKRELLQYSLSHMNYNTNSKKGRIGWVRVETYGGMLVENATSGVARDILAHAMPKLEAAGYPVVAHVHDEPFSEVPIGFGSIEEFESIMMDLPDWAAGWPIKAAGGWRGHRYRKE